LFLGQPNSILDRGKNAVTLRGWLCRALHSRPFASLSSLHIKIRTHLGSATHSILHIAQTSRWARSGFSCRFNVALDRALHPGINGGRLARWTLKCARQFLKRHLIGGALNSRTSLHPL